MWPLKTQYSFWQSVDQLGSRLTNLYSIDFEASNTMIAGSRLKLLGLDYTLLKDNAIS